MPSGSKKRKAAKKKLQQATHNNNVSHSVSHRVDDPKPHQNSDEAKTSNKFNDVTIVSVDNFEESQKTKASKDRSSSSGSSSSSEDDEVKVEKENSGQSSYSEATPSSETHEPAEVNEAVYLPQESNSTTSDLVESHIEQNMDETLPLSHDQTRIDTETLLPKDSNDRRKELEKNISSEEQPLVYTRPLPAHRTSWMNCCGLLDVLSRGSSR